MGVSQGEAVFQAVLNTVGEINGKVELTDAQKAEVHEQVFQAFKTGVCSHKSNPDDGALRKYIPGLVNNWCRKDPRLNGGGKYVAKRPGSRAGSGDESLKNMRLLLTMTTDPLARAAIEAEIADRIAAIKPKVAVNVDALPPSLRKFVKS